MQMEKLNNSWHFSSALQSKLQSLPWFGSMEVMFSAKCVTLPGPGSSSTTAPGSVPWVFGSTSPDERRFSVILKASCILCIYCDSERVLGVSCLVMVVWVLVGWSGTLRCPCLHRCRLWPACLAQSAVLLPLIVAKQISKHSETSCL